MRDSICSNKQATIIKAEDIKGYTRAQLLEIINTQFFELERKEHQTRALQNRINAEAFMLIFGRELAMTLRQIPFCEWPAFCQNVFTMMSADKAFSDVQKTAYRESIVKPFIE